MCNPVALVTGGASLISGVLGKKASDKQAKATAQAAADQSAATKAAAELAYKNTQEAIGSFKESDPFLGLGEGAKAQMAKLMGFDGADPTEMLRSTPGYQFAFDEGMNALQHSLGANNALYSGKAMKEMTRYGQGMADQLYQQTFNNRLAIMQGASGAAGEILSATTGAENNLANGSGVSANQMASGKMASAEIKAGGTQSIIDGVSGIGSAIADAYGTKKAATNPAPKATHAVMGG